MKRYTPFILRLIVAVILIQTLRFKLTAHPDSVYIFEKIGLEPFGRIGIGILELIAGILLLIPRTVWAGATLTLGLIGGAIMMHLTQLGIEVMYKGEPDGGQLFTTACITFVLSAIILFLYKKDIPIIGKCFA
ncbi:DoxX family membrane protein [Pseudofulvibacter geojedonensis]|uniref:DoxX family membrane protein n=1 Tax=Pseudofulvibacter geojedonensis TaxID=1123758 RepID=A0ABW3HZ53_9FLAO